MLKLPDGTVKVLVEGQQRAWSPSRGCRNPFQRYGDAEVAPLLTSQVEELRALRRVMMHGLTSTSRS